MLGQGTGRWRAIRAQPALLLPLAGSEMLERFAFFGMQGVLFLYLREQFSNGGDEAIRGAAELKAILGQQSDTSGPQLASALFGLVTGLIYLFTIVGGWLADRRLGARAAIAWGGAISIIGYLLLTLPDTFLVGLILIALGTGGFKGNIASTVGALYGPDDPRRERGFQLYLIAVNLGMFVAPLVCGTLGETQGWRWGFLAAAIGMAASLALFLRVAGRLPPAATAAAERHTAADAREAWTWPKALATALVLAALATAFTGVQQIYNAYLGWAMTALDLTWGGQTIPTTWLLSLDTAFQVLMISAIAWLWALWARIAPEPGPLAKIALGLGLYAVAYGCLAIADADGPRAFFWVVAFHALNSLGFAVIAPVALAFLTGRAPLRSRSTVVGLFYLQFAIGSFAAGALGAGLGHLSAEQFWTLHAGIMAAAGLLLFAGRRWIDTALSGPTRPALPSAQDERAILSAGQASQSAGSLG